MLEIGTKEVMMFTSGYMKGESETEYVSEVPRQSDFSLMPK